MANYQAVFAVGDSLATFLQNSYNSDGVGATGAGKLPCTFKLFSSMEMTTEDQAHEDSVVSIYLHRITTSEHFRAVTNLPDQPADQPVLFLDLHYLITYWAAGVASAEAEQKILAWTMQQLQSHAILDYSILSLSGANADWATTESVQLTPTDLSLEDVLRIWESLGPKYRLSLSYVARVVRIDRSVTPGLPVVATRYAFQNGTS